MQELHQLALAGEESVPVADDGSKEVTLLMLVTAFETYGQLTDRCREIIDVRAAVYCQCMIADLSYQASQPIIRTLREYISVLRLTSSGPR